jgi:4-hydroxythreonine-4-phosphate dehydrogenase
MDKPKIGISIGDINGIGPEVIIKTFADKRMLNQCTPVIYASLKTMLHHKKTLSVENMRFEKIASADNAKPGQINVIDCWNEEATISMGEVSETAGRFAHISLDYCLNDVKEKKIDAMVTAPINKKSMQLANFPYPGHTEYLEKESEGKALMMLCHEGLRVALVTTHIPVSEIASSLDKKRIMSTINRLNTSLKVDFGIERPQIAVLGLNPHAGDQGVMGDDEKKYIEPALKEIKRKGIFAHGPFAADGFFGSSAYKNYDGILAMYHDQGLVAFKSISFGNGVNFSAGLDIVRTSPDHGTGFDIAGKNKADEGSFRNAIFSAIDISRTRSQHIEDHKNKLKPSKKRSDK